MKTIMRRANIASEHRNDVEMKAMEARIIEAFTKKI